MTKVRKSLSRRALAGVSAIALGLTGVAALSTAANADTGNIDPEAESSLTIHKYLGLHDGDFGPNNGTELEGDDVPDLDTADGVEFTVRQVGVIDGDENCVALDVTDTDDWDLIAGAYGTDPEEWGDEEGDYCFVDGKEWTESTDGGVAVFNPGLGFYYVTEGDDSGNNNIVQKAEPFFVTIPYPSYAGDAEETHVWTYDVHVYPKNQKADNPTKEIDKDPSDLTVGSTVTWTIEVVIPETKDDITEASVYDQLDERLKYKTSTVKVDDTEVEADEVAFPTVNQEGGTLTWTFTDPAGLELINANKGKTITVEFVTEVTAVGDDGQIQNAFGELGNGYGSSFNDVETPGENTPETYWGQLSILKTDDSATPQVLEGAEFQVFEKGTGDCATDWEDAGTPVATGTSDENGVVRWEDVTPNSVLGLFIGNWSNIEDDMVPDNPSKDYCVYETKAPAGYTVGQIANPVTITPGAENLNNFSVVNVQNEGPELPLTGANGTMLMILGGIALVVTAGGVHLVSKRRREQAA